MIENNELERIGQKWPWLLDIPFPNFPEGAEKNHEEPTRTVGAPSEIRTENLPNTSVVRFRYTKLLGEPCSKPVLNRFSNRVFFVTGDACLLDGTVRVWPR
jgi:hypothetical protein